VPEGTSTVCVPPPKPLKVTLGMQNLCLVEKAVQLNYRFETVSLPYETSDRFIARISQAT